MAIWDDKTAERFAELTRMARGKANTLGDDVDIISEPFRQVNNVILEETWQQIPSADGGLVSPNYDSYGVSGDIGTRYEISRLHSYLPSGITGADSVQTFFVVSSAPSSHGVDDIELVRRKNLISPIFSPNKSNAASPDDTERGFELVLYPAKSSPGGGIGDLLVADEAKPIPITADPGGGPPIEMAPGLGSEGFWSASYMAGIVRLSRSPLNGSGGVFNPHSVYGDIDGVETLDGYGAITMFATYYQYTGVFGQQDENNFVVVGDGYISNGDFEGTNQNTVQSALDSLTSGGTVFIKEGDYIFSSSVDIPSNKSVIGLNSRVIITTPSNQSAFNIDGDNIRIKGITFRTTGSSGGSCIRLVGSTVNETLENIKLVDNQMYCKGDAYGVEISPASTDIVYKNIEIHNNIFKNELDDDGIFVAVGASGEIQTSPDGTTWVAQSGALGSDDIFSIAHDGFNLWVGVGSTGGIQTSPDGINWTQQTAAAAYSNTFYGVAHDSSGLWCIIGNVGEIQTSPDGITWTHQTADASYSGGLRKVAHDGVGLWCIVGQTGEIQTSPDGINWTHQTAAASFAGFFANIAHDKFNLWVAVGASGEIQTSPDGITWTQQTADASYSDSFNGVAYDGAGLWCAVGDSGEIQTSSDGITWTQRTAAASFAGFINAIAYDSINELWCVIGSSGEIQTSPDGITWTHQTAAGAYSNTFYGVAFPSYTPTYIGTRYADGYCSVNSMSIVGNKFNKPPGNVSLGPYITSLKKLLVSHNIGSPHFSLLGINGYTSETIITDNNFGIVTLDDIQNSLFSDNVVGNIVFSIVDKSIISNNRVRYFGATSISGTNLIGNYVDQNNLNISPSCHIWDGYISADGPNVYIDDNLLPKVMGQELGSRNNRWDGYFTRLDIGDATTVITDGYISSNRKLEISAGLNDVEIHSRVIQRGPNNSSVTLNNGELKVNSGRNYTAISDGYISSNKTLGISSGRNSTTLYSKTINLGNRSHYASEWIHQTPDASYTGGFEDVVYDGFGLWCIVGGSGEIQTSTDGITWVHQAVAFAYSGTFIGVAYDGSGLWCAVGTSGEIQTSPDGVTWTHQTPDAAYSSGFLGVAHDGSGLWCIVGQTGEIQTSPDGVTWTHQTADGAYAGSFNNVEHDGSGLWCAVGTSGEIQTSPDGVTWTEQTPDAAYASNFNGVAHDGSGLWCAVGQTGEIQTSPDGVTWTQQTQAGAYSDDFVDLSYDGIGLWCVVGQTGEIQASPDGITWTQQTSAALYSGTFADVVNDGSGLWCAVGTSGEIQTALDFGRVSLDSGKIQLDAVTSEDGYISSNKTLGISAGTNDIELHSRVIQKGPNDSSVILDNGDIRLGQINVKNFLLALGPSTWTPRTAADSFNGNFFGAGHNSSDLWCAVGASGEIQTSPDGVTWTHRGPDDLYSDSFLSIAHDDGYGQWCAVGTSGEIQTSTNGFNWTHQTQDDSFSGSFLGIAYNGVDLWCAVGASGEIQTSPDGVTWTHRGPDDSFASTFFDIAHDDGYGQWCAVGASGEIQTSTNGFNWTHQTQDDSFSGSFLGIAYNGVDLWCAVGDSGEIQTSPDGVTWTQQIVGNLYNNALYNVAYDGVGLWCVVGELGEIQTSPDGVTWTHRIQGVEFSDTFRSIANDSIGLWCAVGHSGEIQKSLRIPLPQ